MATTTTQRTRRRAIAPTKAKNAVPKELTKLAVTFYRENKAMNASKNASEKARKELFKGMKGEGIKRFDLETDIDGTPIYLDVEIGAGRATTVVDIAALRKNCTEEEFMQIVSATVKAVEDIKGKEVLNLCSVTKDGTENVTVKPRK